MYVSGGTGEQASIELVDCVISKNGVDCLFVHEGKALLLGGTISENNRDGVFAWGGKVTVATAEEDRPQTVSKDNDGHDWHERFMGDEGSEIIGIPQDKIHRD